jgi:hypothetical protein
MPLSTIFQIYYGGKFRLLMWKTVYAEQIFIVRFKNSYVVVAPYSTNLYFKYSLFK